MSGEDVQKSLTPIKPDTGVPTQVDIGSLEGAVPWLEELKKYVAERLVIQTRTMHLTEEMGKLYFGDVSQAPDVYGKHNRYVERALESYLDIAHALDVAVQATKSIVQNYKDAERNNALDVAAVEKAFADSQGGTGTGAGVSGTSATPVADAAAGSSGSGWTERAGGL